MSDMGPTLDILGTDPQASPAILLLRTIAIYSGSKRVAIPLSVAYTVRPQDKRPGLCGSPYVQVSVVAGIVLNCFFLSAFPGE